MSLDSTVGVAKIGTKSLRATVPEGIVAFLGIQSGDKLEWRMDMQNGERVVVVRKASSSQTTKPSSPTKPSRPKHK
jgi:bifunctional DNA-binding transcriptional regulator/antitoxin component of YhaV-PrlF toxin-antitoxin module